MISHVARNETDTMYVPLLICLARKCVLRNVTKGRTTSRNAGLVIRLFEARLSVALRSCYRSIFNHCDPVRFVRQPEQIRHESVVSHFARNEAS